MEEEIRDWRELPELLLWLIKARLGMVDSLMFSAVCKNWRGAFQRFPDHLKLTTDVPPWLMVSNHKFPDSIIRHFINVSPQGGRLIGCSIKREAFKRTILLGSAAGWLLLAKVKDVVSSPDSDVGIQFETPNPIFAINPFTNSIVELPGFNVADDDDDLSPPLWGGVSVQNNAPSLVVVSRASHISMEIWHARPGDDRWKYSCYDTYMLKIVFDANNHYRSLVGDHHVCWVDVDDRMITFDLENYKWEYHGECNKFDDDALYSMLGLGGSEDDDDDEEEEAGVRRIKFDRKDHESTTDCLECPNSFVICSSRGRGRGSREKKKVYHCDFQNFGDNKYSITIKDLVNDSQKSIPVRSLKLKQVGNWVDLG